MEEEEDQIVWKLTPIGVFSLKFSWDNIQVVMPKVEWAKLFWFNSNIPRHSMIAWLAWSNALKTHDFLVRHDILQVDGLSPDELIMVHVLFVCAHAGALELRKWLDVYIQRNKLDSRISVKDLRHL
ncbi:hypothetical protein HHK36_010963 [Tetracentron sinense]|uniref:Reverse transcriptase zinc-binding domain-containing protein n=1 Tax=Tetracentron sinense TaxID=13715 RepID=A0A835DGX8_TETSI|nr:hypothetical protein HHK36_010963 [Tetracentron sinense]